MVWAESSVFVSRQHFWEMFLQRVDVNGGWEGVILFDDSKGILPRFKRGKNALPAILLLLQVYLDWKYVRTNEMFPLY